MRELFYSFSEETIYHRFFGVLRDMPPERLRYFVNVDYENSTAIVAVVEEQERERLIAVGRYARTTDSDRAEVAFVVQDRWQSKGIGTFLLNYLIEIAKKHGIGGFTAEVMSDNTRMLHVFEKSGYNIRSTVSGNIYQISFRFDNFKTEA